MQAPAHQKDVTGVARLLLLPAGSGDTRRFFIERAALHIGENPGRVADGASHGGVVTVTFEELNSKQRQGHIVRGEGDGAFGIVHGARVVAKLQGGFDEGAVDLETLRRIGIFFQVGFEAANQSGAVGSGRGNDMLELLLRRRARFEPCRGLFLLSGRSGSGSGLVLRGSHRCERDADGQGQEGANGVRRREGQQERRAHHRHRKPTWVFAGRLLG